MGIIVALASLFVVAYLPGALIFRAPVADRGRRAALAPEERAFWGVVLSVALTSLVALGLAAPGWYSLPRVIGADLAVSLAIVFAWRTRLRFDAGSSRPGWWALAPAGLLALGLALFFPPAEYVMGGKDPGTYLNEGVQIAQHGSLRIHEPLIASLPAPASELFSRSPAQFRRQRDHQGGRFMGFFIVDRARGIVVGQFPHLFPAWIAIGYGLDGLRGALATVGVWALLGLLAVYFAGARLVGRPAAAAGTALLAINVAEVWFARYPNSEVVQQALLFAGLLALARAQQDGDRFFGPVAAVVLGLMMFLRLDAVIAIGAVAAGLALGMLDGKRPSAAFLVPFGALLALAGLYLVWFLWPYLAMPVRFLLSIKWVVAAAGALGAAGLGALVWLSAHPTFSVPLRRSIPRLAAVAVVVSAVYAYFLRMPGGLLAEHDAWALRTFAWYVAPAGLFAGVLGYALVSWRSFWRDPTLLVTAACYSFFLFYKIRIVPEHFWMARRFLPIILPMTCLMASGAAFFGFRTWQRARAAGHVAGSARFGAWRHLAVPAIFLSFLGWIYLGATRPILNHVEYAGLIPRLEDLARRFGDRDLVIVESRRASDLHVLAEPLAYVFGRNVLLLKPLRPDKTKLEALVAWAAGRYAHVYFMGGGGTALLAANITVTPVASEQFQIPEYESLRNAYPREVRQKTIAFGIFTLTPGAGPVATTVDVGGTDDVYVVRFQGKERGEGVTYRWTRNRSLVVLPALPAGTRAVTVVMSNGGRPRTVPPARVQVWLNETELGDVEVTAGFHPYTFAIPAPLAAGAAGRRQTAVFTLVCTTWNPQQALGGPDNRRLGVMVDRVILEPASDQKVQ